MTAIRGVVIAALMGGVLCGCASQTEMGLRAYNTGNYEKAYERWAASAQAGEPYAQYNMGVLWQGGLSAQTPQNPDKAADWFLLAARQGLTLAMAPLAEYQLSKGHPDEAVTWLNLGARWNDPASVARLKSMNAPVPAPDLALARQQVLIAQQQALADSSYVMGQAIGCAIGGGCRSPAQVSLPRPTPTTTCRARPMPDLRGNPVYTCQ